MSPMNTEKALAWIANVFEEPSDRVTRDTQRDEIQAWDSLGMLTLMSVLDEEFEIFLSEEQLQDMKSVHDILEVLRSHGMLQDGKMDMRN